MRKTVEESKSRTVEKLGEACAEEIERVEEGPAGLLIYSRKGGQALLVPACSLLVEKLPPGARRDAVLPKLGPK